MKLYEVPRNTKIRIIDDKTSTPVASYPVEKNQTLHYYNIDGMYSYCKTHDGVVAHRQHGYRYFCCGCC